MNSYAVLCSTLRNDELFIALIFLYDKRVTYRYSFMNYDLLSPSCFKDYDSEYIMSLSYINAIGYDIYSTAFDRNAHSFVELIHW